MHYDTKKGTHTQTTGCQSNPPNVGWMVQLAPLVPKSDPQKRVNGTSQAALKLWGSDLLECDKSCFHVVFVFFCFCFACLFLFTVDCQLIVSSRRTCHNIFASWWKAWLVFHTQTLQDQLHHIQSLMSVPPFLAASPSSRHEPSLVGPGCSRGHKDGCRTQSTSHRRFVRALINSFCAELSPSRANSAKPGHIYGWRTHARFLRQLSQHTDAGDPDTADPFHHREHDIVSGLRPSPITLGLGCTVNTLYAICSLTAGLLGAAVLKRGRFWVWCSAKWGALWARFYSADPVSVSWSESHCWSRIAPGPFASPQLCPTSPDFSLGYLLASRREKCSAKVAFQCLATSHISTAVFKLAQQLRLQSNNQAGKKQWPTFQLPACCVGWAKGLSCSTVWIPAESDWQEGRLWASDEPRMEVRVGGGGVGLGE